MYTTSDPGWENYPFFQYNIQKTPILNYPGPWLKKFSVCSTNSKKFHNWTTSTLVEKFSVIQYKFQKFPKFHYLGPGSMKYLVFQYIFQKAPKFNYLGPRLKKFSIFPYKFSKIPLPRTLVENLFSSSVQAAEIPKFYYLGPWLKIRLVFQYKLWFSCRTATLMSQEQYQWSLAMASMGYIAPVVHYLVAELQHWYRGKLFTELGACI